MAACIRVIISERKLDGNPFDYWSRFDLAVAQLVLGETSEAMKQVSLAVQSLQTANPLEILQRDLERLGIAPHPPADLDQILHQVEQAIIKIKSEA